MSRARADSLIAMAQTLPAALPGTKAGLEAGVISRYKAEIIAGATVLLEDDEARAAEAEVLDRAARLTPAGLRAAIARAVIKAAPEKAKERRETAAKNARVERWLQDTGNAALMGCELPPAEALAADEQITARAKELRKAGLEGDMDQLRARAYLDLLLGTDSRPRRGGAGTAAPPPAPAGFAARITLTAPLATLAGLADRPGELAGLGPVDPWLARDLAAAAAANPRTTWCLTVTDSQGHAVAHGCARPEPKRHANRAGPDRRTGPGSPSLPAGRDGPRGGYGTWRLTTPGPGPDLIITIDPITTDPCDHRFESSRHDPGVKLRHLSQVRHATCTSPDLPQARRPVPTTSTTPPTKQAAGPVSATPARSAVMTIGSSSTPGGTSTSSRTAPSAGPPQPGAPTTPNPPATPSERGMLPVLQLSSQGSGRAEAAKPSSPATSGETRSRACRHPATGQDAGDPLLRAAGGCSPRTTA